MHTIDPLLLFPHSARRDAVRGLLCAAMMLMAVASAGVASAQTLDLVVHLGTGELWLENANEEPFGLVYYSVSSDAGVLDSADGVWTSIAATYDASGDGSVDPTAEWSELSASNTMLAEGVFAGAGGTLAANQQLSLGLIWAPSVGFADLTGEVVSSEIGAVPIAMPIIYRNFAADFDFDFDVDADDLAIWRQYLGTGTKHTEGDADLDGDVDGDDFLQWQRDSAVSANAAAGMSLGMTVSARTVSLSMGAVPEPGTVWLLSIGAGMAMAARRAGRRR